VKVEETLQMLFKSLRRLVEILQLDPKCQWTAKFRADLDLCLSLITNGFSRSDLAELSSSITYVFQGMGSFNDYSPSVYDPASGRYSPITGSEDFESVTKEVFDLATSLRTNI